MLNHRKVPTAKNMYNIMKKKGDTCSMSSEQSMFVRSAKYILKEIETEYVQQIQRVSLKVTTYSKNYKRVQ